MENILVVNNFNAGRKQAIKYKKSLIKFFLQNKKSFKFINIDELSEFDTAAFDTIIAVGGDGTVNKIVPYVINTDKVLGIIPAGTANLLAAKAGISSNIDKAVKIIENGKTKKIDCLHINEKYCVLRTGFGYDSDIICKTPQSLKNKFGYFAYFIAGILFALRLKQKNYKIKINEEEQAFPATCIIVANAGNMYKNIVSVSKNCKLDDGLMDVFILDVQNPILYFFEFLKIIFKSKSNTKNVKYIQTSNIEIENDFCNCHIDGEKTKIKDNIKINITPKSVNIICN